MKAAKYPPLGGRSWGGYTAFQTYGMSPADYLKKANTITQVFAMIETQAALDAVEEIAAVPGLDGLFRGAERSCPSPCPRVPASTRRPSTRWTR